MLSSTRHGALLRAAAIIFSPPRCLLSHRVPVIVAQSPEELEETEALTGMAPSLPKHPELHPAMAMDGYGWLWQEHHGSDDRTNLRPKFRKRLAFQQVLQAWGASQISEWSIPFGHGTAGIQTVVSAVAIEKCPATHLH